MQHLICYFLGLAICETLLGFTVQGDGFGSFRWPMFFMVIVMAVVGTYGFYKNEKSRYFALSVYACLPFLPIGLLPAYFFWKWVDWLGQCDDRIRAKVLKEMALKKQAAQSPGPVFDL